MTRRALRDRHRVDDAAAGADTAGGGTTGTLAPPSEPASPADPGSDPLAALAAADDRMLTVADAAPGVLAWVDLATVAAPRTRTNDLGVAASGGIPTEPDLLGRPPRRSPLRPGVLIPTAILAMLVGLYVAGALLWPLHAVAPTVTAATVEPVAAPASAMPWPGAGSAGVSVAGIPGSLASTGDAAPMASITKVVTALLVLDQMPLQPGEQGPEFRFTFADSDDYWQYRINNESALDVPVGGVLTQYQLLEGMLMGSANNYADRLAGNLWPSDAVFADAANAWLRTHGVAGVTVVEPTGIDFGNVATPDGLVALAARAMANPVIAEIVGKRSVEIPGAGLVENTNGLLADPGVVGIKTGSLDAYTLLSAKDISVGDTVVRLYASVLGQPDDAARLAATRALFTQLEAELQPQPAVAGRTVAGYVETRWGESVQITTGSDASVVLWNGGTASLASTFALGDARDAGAVVGTLTATGPLNSATVDLQLAEDVEPPSPWWRLTHPLELLGLTD